MPNRKDTQEAESPAGELSEAELDAASGGVAAGGVLAKKAGEPPEPSRSLGVMMAEPPDPILPIGRG